MNAIHVILLLGIWVSAIVNGLTYLRGRDDFLRSGEREQPPSLKKARNSFLSTLALAIVYSIIKLT